MKYIAIIHNNYKGYYWIQEQVKVYNNNSYGTAIATDYGFYSESGHLNFDNCTVRPSTEKEIAYLNYIKQLRMTEYFDKISLKSFLATYKKLIIEIY